jgi:hypothetical protein
VIVLVVAASDARERSGASGVRCSVVRSSGSGGRRLNMRRLRGRLGGKLRHGGQSRLDGARRCAWHSGGDGLPGVLRAEVVVECIEQRLTRARST